MSRRRAKVLPSILASDPGAFRDAIRVAEVGGADGLHIDIMDGHFATNIALGFEVVRLARSATTL